MYLNNIKRTFLFSTLIQDYKSRNTLWMSLLEFSLVLDDTNIYSNVFINLVA